MPCIRFDPNKTLRWSLASFDLSEKLDLVTEGRKIGLYHALLKLNFLLFSSAPCISSPSTFMSIPFYFFCQPLVFLLSIPLYFFCHPLVLLLSSPCISFAIPLYFVCPLPCISVKIIGSLSCFLSFMFMIWLIFYDLTLKVSPSCSTKINFPRPCKTSSTVEFPRFDSNEVLCFNIARKWNICSSERSTCHIYDWGCFQRIFIKELVTDPMQCLVTN